MQSSAVGKRTQIIEMEGKQVDLETTAPPDNFFKCTILGVFLFVFVLSIKQRERRIQTSERFELRSFAQKADLYTITSPQKSLFLKGSFRPLFFIFIFHLSIKLPVYSCQYQITHVWIRTTYFRCQKQPLNYLHHTPQWNGPFPAFFLYFIFSIKLEEQSCS